MKKEPRDLKNALFEKERAQEQLIRAQSLAAIGQLVAGVAHEINNPLSSSTSLVQSTVEDLEKWNRETPPDQNLIDDMKFAIKELGRAKGVVASLLGLSRQSQSQFETINMNNVVKDALRILNSKIKQSNVEIDENYDEDLPDIKGNFANLGQVFLNIILNAFQAVGEKRGRINIATHYDKMRKRLFLNAKITDREFLSQFVRIFLNPFLRQRMSEKGQGSGFFCAMKL